jgi:hypothetical protein
MTSRTSPRLPAGTSALRKFALATMLCGLFVALMAQPSVAGTFDSSGTSPGGAEAPAAVTPQGGVQSPDDFSAGDQYVETLPSTKGPKAADGKHKKDARLPRRIEQKVAAEGGSEAEKLLQIATSTQLGAPDRKLTKKQQNRRAKRDGASRPAVPSAAIDAVGGGDAGLGMLVIWMMGITAIALGAVGYRRLRNKDSSSG